MSPAIVGVICIVVLFLFLLLGMPIGFAMLAVGFLGYGYLVSLEGALNMLSTTLFPHFASYSMTVIPMFILTGQIAFHAGISRRLFSSAEVWLGSRPGGLAMATVGGCAGFAAICGSSVATAVTMGTVALPEMRKRNYIMSLATGCVAAGGTLGVLIPPSIVLILYGILTGQSIGKLFIAGILPGILLSALFITAIYILCRLNPGLGPRGPRTTFKKKMASLSGTVEMVALFILIMGGLVIGFFTPTEAGAVGVAGALLISLARRELGWQGLKTALWETAGMSCMVMVLVGGGLVLGRLVTISRISMELANIVSEMSLPPLAVLIMVILVYLIAGCLVDALSFMIISVPVFFPMIAGLGYDPIWFGVIIVILLESGAVTPPVGLNVYAIASSAPDVPIQDIFKGIVPFVLTMIVCIGILIVFPQIVTLLPGLVR